MKRKAELEWVDALIPHLTDEELVKLRDAIDVAITQRSPAPRPEPERHAREPLTRTTQVRRREDPKPEPVIGNEKWNSGRRMPWPDGYSPRRLQI